MAQSISELLNRTKEKVEKLNSPNVEKAIGVAKLLSIVIDLFHVLTLMSKRMSKMEKKTKELQDQLSALNKRVDS